MFGLGKDVMYCFADRNAAGVGQPMETSNGRQYWVEVRNTYLSCDKVVVAARTRGDAAARAVAYAGVGYDPITGEYHVTARYV